MKTNNLFLILFSMILISCQKEDVAVEIKPEVEEESYEGTFRGMMTGTKTCGSYSEEDGPSRTVTSESEEASIDMSPYGVDSVVFTPRNYFASCYDGTLNVFQIDSLKNGVRTECSPTDGINFDVFVQLKGIDNDTLLINYKFYRITFSGYGSSTSETIDYQYLLLRE